MKQTAEQIQEIQILYELAMSIGTSLDLHQMLKVSLSTLLKKLNCSAGGVYQFKKNNGNFRYELVYAIPRNIGRNQTYQTALEQIPAQLNDQNLSDFTDQLPQSGQSNEDSFFHILSLPGFGLMILVKNGTDFTPSFIKSLKPLQLKLVNACNACLTEQALVESRERFRQVVSSVSHHIYMTEFTADGNQINHYISPNVETLTGYSQEKFQDDWRFWQSLIHPDDREIAAGQVEQFIRGHDSQVEYRLMRADGGIFWVNDSGRVERNGTQQNLVVYGIISDVTEHRHTAEVLALARDHAMEASRLKTELLAKVSHELRTPLNAILGYADMLQQGIRGPLAEQQEQAIDRIMINSDRLGDLVNSLLDQARMEKVEVKLHLAPFTLTNFINHTEATFNPKATEKGLKLTSSIAAEVPPTIVGDVKRLQDILFSLVGNAIKFTPTGSIQIRVYHPSATHWALQVSDTGPGIPTEIQAYVFEPFWQADGSITREHGGVGLGLSIAKQLATLMGGQITLESELNNGSTFTVLLPLIWEETK